MKDEMDAMPVPLTPGPGIASAIANVGRDLQKEAYMMQSNNMANKTEVSYPGCGYILTPIHANVCDRRCSKP